MRNRLWLAGLLLVFPLMRAVADDPTPLVSTPSQAREWLEQESRRLIRGCRRTMRDGTAAFPPQVGSHYDAFWLRDYVYMLEGCPEAFAASELRDACRLFVRAANAEGAGVDCIRFDGEPIYQPGYGTMGEHPVADGSLFTIELAWLTHQQLHDRALLEEIVPRLKQIHRGIPRNPDSGLVTIGTQGYDRCPWGFTDTVRKQGDELFCSVLLVQASRHLAELCEALDDPAATDYRKEAERVAAQVRVTLWDDELGLFRAATLKCGQPDLFGSAFAVASGTASPAQAKRIADYFVAHADEVIRRGQLRHLPSGMYWDEACPRDTYQNGGYWGMPIGWLLLTVEPVDPSLGNRILLDLVRDYQQHGVREWTLGAASAVPDYVVSCTLPLAGARQIARRRQPAP